jgi:hypothetical protein
MQRFAPLRRAGIHDDIKWTPDQRRTADALRCIRGTVPLNERK